MIYTGVQLEYDLSSLITELQNGFSRVSSNAVRNIENDVRIIVRQCTHIFFSVLMDFYHTACLNLNLNLL